MEIPDLIEKDGAPVGRLKPAHLELVSARKRAAFVTEELAFQEFLWHRGTVDLHEWPKQPIRG